MKVLVLGAGGPAANGYVNSLRVSGHPYHIIGADADQDNLRMAFVNQPKLLPADDLPALLRLVRETEPDVVYAQADACVDFLSQHRNDVRALGPKVFLPRAQVVKVCADKWLSYQAWRDCGVPVPETWLIENEDDLHAAFDACWMLWFRPVYGAGGAGAFCADSRVVAEVNLNDRSGWGEYTAAEVLTERTVVWQAVYFHGELVTSQTRRRLAWTNGDRGSCLIGETITDPHVDDVARNALRAVDLFPHGIYGVDLCYHDNGRHREPMPTEINAGRFNTTIHFYTTAGLNMPHLYTQLAVGNDDGTRDLVNPLPSGLKWVRMMDREPLLVDDAATYRRDNLAKAVAAGA